MKKSLIIICISFLIILLILTITLINLKSRNKLLQKENGEYEYYTNRQIYGTDVATVINKAVDNNIKYEVTKNSEGFFVEDDKYSIIIKVQMIGIDEQIEMEKIFSLRYKPIYRII